MKERFGCKHCKRDFCTPRDVVLHIYTDHLHQDIALKPEVSRFLLSGARVLVEAK